MSHDAVNFARYVNQKEERRREMRNLAAQFDCLVEDAPDSYQAQGMAYTLVAPCGCCACNDGAQPGHFACETPLAALLQAERDGLVTRHLDGSTWRWFVC